MEQNYNKLRLFIGSCFALLVTALTFAMRAKIEEIFGPVVSVVRRKNLDEVVDLVNTRDYANASCIYTQDAANVQRFKYKVQPAMVGVNIGIAAPMSFFPFGGSGNSMFGDTKAHGQEIFNFFTDTKVVIQRWF